MDREISARQMSVFERTRIFLRDFAPEDPLQFLFPLGTFLLILGSSPWVRVPRGLSAAQIQVLLGQGQLWFANLEPGLTPAFYSVPLPISFAMIASIVLWCLPTRNPVQAFARWVFLPICLGLSVFLLMILVAVDPRFSDIEPSSQVILEMMRRLPSRMPTIGYGFYFTVAGAVVLLRGLWMVRSGRLSLPINFRERQTAFVKSVEDSNGRREIMIFLIATTVFAAAISFFPFLLNLIRADSSFRTGIRYTAIFEWLPGLANAAAAAICGYWILAKRDRESAHKLLRRLPGEKYILLSVFIPMLIVFVPRLFLKVFREFTFTANGAASGRFPPSWSDLLLPQEQWATPYWVSLVVLLLIAVLEELAIRGFLQTKLTRMFGLKQAIFLTALLWMLLPHYQGLGPLRNLPIPVPGAATVVTFAIFIVYSVPLGWLYARTRSAIPVALAHATILSLHSEGWYDLYFHHPELYWLEIVGWAFTGWFLFKKYPIRQREVSSIPLPPA